LTESETSCYGEDMRLTEPEIQRIIEKLVAEWKSSQIVRFEIPELKLKERLAKIFIQELKVDDDLNKEVDKILQQYEKQFESGALDRRKMFQMVKNQLAKERRIVL